MWGIDNKILSQEIVCSAVFKNNKPIISIRVTSVTTFSIYEE
jgi:hypothetical protein